MKNQKWPKRTLKGSKEEKELQKVERQEAQDAKVKRITESNIHVLVGNSKSKYWLRGTDPSCYIRAERVRIWANQRSDTFRTGAEGRTERNQRPRLNDEDWRAG
ncbi:hypothetical protein C8F04DRAFT_1177247 [Mycena alexandri]|uniref:Uncharacterized protein n=1 Tax=Mycena alexandri TaxID=1745969 RepID=A0AAD6XDM3_9AGAR|nr:hypothetical protein C8F04DRAFT_1177247 [Mycena alexandri]